MPEIFTATGDSVCCLQRIGKKPLPHFHIFLLPTFLQTAKSETLKTLFTTGLVQDALLWGRFFSANFRLTSERPLALFFDTKKHIQVVPKIFTATGDSVCCLQRIGKKPFVPSFSHFPITYLFTNRKVKNASNTAYCGTANALAVRLFFLGKFPLNIGTSVGFVF